MTDLRLFDDKPLGQDDRPDALRRTVIYADPPYLGCGNSRYGHPEWDDINRHAQLIGALESAGHQWAMSLSSVTLRDILPLCPPTVRVAAWVKPFAVFRPNVNPAYAWEPVIVSERGARKRTRTERTVRDFHPEAIALKRGLVGAKPPGFNEWILDLLGAIEGDVVEDWFPGTQGMALAAARRRVAYTPVEGWTRSVTPR